MWPYPHPPIAKRAKSISKATFDIFRRPARSFCSTALGTTASFDDRYAGTRPVAIPFCLRLLLSDKLTFIALSLQLAARNFFLRTLDLIMLTSALLADWADGFRMFPGKDNLLRLVTDR
jgi:hypothetical protein